MQRSSPTPQLQSSDLEHIHELEQLKQGLVLDPIQNLQQDLKIAVQTHSPSNLTELEQFINEERIRSTKMEARNTISHATTVTQKSPLFTKISHNLMATDVPGLHLSIMSFFYYYFTD